MKKLFNRALVCGGALVGTMGVALAEGEAAAGEVSATLLTPFIDSGKTEVVTLLTAGAAIVGAFFVWGLIKKALNRSK